MQGRLEYTYVYNEMHTIHSSNIISLMLSLLLEYAVNGEVRKEDDGPC